MRSHSTEKQSTFISKLDNRIGNVGNNHAHDDSSATNNQSNNPLISRNGQGQHKASNGNGKRKGGAPQAFIPRTGIEHPFTREKHRFIESHREFESIHCCNPSLSEEYARLDAERLINPQNYMNKVVYDCIDPSPFYDDPQNPYIDESEAIELPSDDQHVDYRKYPYGPTVASNSFNQNFNARGMKINRWYNKLKPYY